MAKAKVSAQEIKIKKIDMVSAISNPGGFEANTGYHFNIKFAPNNTQAKADLTITLEMTNHPEEFHIELTMEGLFALTGIIDTETKKDAHIMCYDVLCAVENHLITQLVSNGGIAGFELPKVPLKREKIDYGEETEGSKIIDFPPQ